MPDTNPAHRHDGWLTAHTVFDIIAPYEQGQRESVFLDNIHRNAAIPPSAVSVALFSHFYWTFFSVLGSVIGQLLPFQLEGVDFCMTALFVIIFIDKWEHADRHSPALIGLGVGVLCLLIFGQNSFMLPALLLSTALLLLITNTDFGKKKGKKDKDTDGENAESKTDSKKIEVVTSPEDIITDEKEERKI